MNKKTVLTVAICLPIVYFIGQIIWQLRLTAQMIGHNNPNQMIEDMFRGLAFILFLALVVMVVIIVATAYLVKHIQLNDQLTDGKKILWTVLLFAFQSIPMIVYTFKYVYKEPWKEVLVRPQGDTKKLTVITGIVTLVPLAFVGILLVKMTRSMPELLTTTMTGGSNANFMTFMLPIIVLELALFFVMFLVFIYYCVIVIKNDQLDNSNRTMWLVLMFFFNILAMCVYWLVYMLYGASKVTRPNPLMKEIE